MFLTVGEMQEHDLEIQADPGSEANHFGLRAAALVFCMSIAIVNKGGHFREPLKELDEGRLSHSGLQRA